MTRRVAFASFAALVLSLMALVNPAAAQQRLFLSSRPGLLVEVNPAPDKLGQVLRRFPIPETMTIPVSVMGGRYLAGQGTDGSLDFLDTVSGQVHHAGVLAPGRILGTNAEGDGLVLIHQFGAGNLEVSTVSLPALRVHVVNLGFPAPSGSAFAYAPRAGLLFVAVARTMNLRFFWDDVRTIDVRTGQEVNRFALGGEDVHHLTVDAAGSRVWITSRDGFFTPGVRMYDVATGARMAENPGLRPYNDPAKPGDVPVLDEARNRFLFRGPDGLVGLDATTLALLGEAPAPRFRGPDTLPPGHISEVSAQVLAGGGASAIYALDFSWSRLSYYPGECYGGQLSAIDADSGDIVGSVPLRFEGRPVCSGFGVLAVAPVRPANFRAEVSGRRVTLSWDRPAQTTHYELEAGSAPGLRDLVRVTPTSVPFVVENVPPGTYYLRVRALNYAGKGEYTEDLTVVVP